MVFLIKQSEGGGRSRDNEEFMKIYGFMHVLVASATATVISNPMHKNFVNCSRHIEYYIAFPWPCNVQIDNSDLKAY